MELFSFHEHQDIAEHSIKVAYEARKLAYKFGVDEHKAFVAGCLRDLGNLFSNDKKITICNEFGINILTEEYIAPSLLHSKISKIMAVEMFSVEDKEVPSAIECHSTLKANAGMLSEIALIELLHRKVNFYRE